MSVCSKIGKIQNELDECFDRIANLLTLHKEQISVGGKLLGLESPINRKQAEDLPDRSKNSGIPDKQGSAERIKTLNCSFIDEICDIRDIRDSCSPQNKRLDLLEALLQLRNQKSMQILAYDELQALIERKSSALRNREEEVARQHAIAKHHSDQHEILIRNLKSANAKLEVLISQNCSLQAVVSQLQSEFRILKSSFSIGKIINREKQSKKINQLMNFPMNLEQKQLCKVEFQMEKNFQQLSEKISLKKHMIERNLGIRILRNKIEYEKMCLESTKEQAQKAKRQIEKSEAEMKLMLEQDNETRVKKLDLEKKLADEKETLRQLSLNEANLQAQLLNYFEAIQTTWNELYQNLKGERIFSLFL